MEQSHSITRLLNEWTNGKPEVLDDLMPLVYEELRRQANAYLRNENPNHTLQATALIHETYLKLINQREAHFNSRSHFFAIAANLMRRILVDHARAKHRDRPLPQGLRVSGASDQWALGVCLWEMLEGARLFRGENDLVTMRNVLEAPIHGDLALIKAERGDRWGNLVYRKAARNFGPVMATAARPPSRSPRSTSGRSSRLCC